MITYVRTDQFKISLKQIIGGRVLYEQISEFFRPVHVLGEGSFAKVLLCYSRINHGQYAVKYITREYENQNQLESI